MPARREPEPAGPGEVPPELIDMGSQVWRDPVQFDQWCRQYGLGTLPARSWWQRFSAGRDAWSVAYGYTIAIGRHGQRTIDHRRLRDAGVPWAGALTRAMCRAEYLADDPEAFRAAALLVPYGDVPDQYPVHMAGPMTDADRLGDADTGRYDKPVF